MSHCAKQITDWMVTRMTGVVGLPTPTLGREKQTAANTESCSVTPINEEIEGISIHDPVLYQRTLSIEVEVLSRTYAEVEEMGVLAEEALADLTTYPGQNLRLVGRAYDEDRETDRDYFAITLQYVAEYATLSTNVETFG